MSFVVLYSVKYYFLFPKEYICPLLYIILHTRNCDVSQMKCGMISKLVWAIELLAYNRRWVEFCDEH